MQRKLAQTGARLEIGAHRALKSEGNSIISAAKKMAPRDDGELRRSAKVDPPHRDGNQIVVRLSFGDEGPASEYALALHEWPSRHDPPSWIGKTINFHTPGTGPQYLATPLRAAMSGMLDRIAARLKL